MVGRTIKRRNMQDNKQKQIWEDLARKNAEYYINSDYGTHITDQQFRESGREDYLNYIYDDELFPKGGHLLEIGCGNGRMTEFMSINYDKVTGTDISKEMIKIGKERLEELTNVSLIETDGFTIPLIQSFDVAFSYIVFQHFKTVEMVNKNFDEVYRVLKPGGIFKVRVRTDDVDLNKWWGGVTSNEEYPLSIGFKLLKKEQVSDYGLWLWLQK
jgi:ubiquinone/menaquinone biosynthesis C-methylase UbiE